MKRQKCPYKKCDGMLHYEKEMEKKGRFGVFKCKKCGSIFSKIKVGDKESLVCVINKSGESK